jgi:hypothetical protein
LQSEAIYRTPLFTSYGFVLFDAVADSHLRTRGALTYQVDNFADTTVTEHRLYAQGCDSTEEVGVEVGDDDDEQGRLDSSDIDLISRFHRAAIECSYGLVEATQAHENTDPELFLVSVNHAIEAWISAHATCKRLAQTLGDAPVVQAAKLGLVQRSRDLGVLLTEAENTFTKPMVLTHIHTMRESLGSLAVELGLSA